MKKRSDQMTAAELAKARRQLGMNQTQMAANLRTPRPTYVKWENGDRRIPGVCKVAVELLLEKDRRLMAKYGLPTGPNRPTSPTNEV